MFTETRTMSWLTGLTRKLVGNEFLSPLHPLVTNGEDIYQWCGTICNYWHLFPVMTNRKSYSPSYTQMAFHLCANVNEPLNERFFHKPVKHLWDQKSIYEHYNLHKRLTAEIHPVASCFRNWYKCPLVCAQLLCRCDLNSQQMCL